MVVMETVVALGTGAIAVGTLAVISVGAVVITALRDPQASQRHSLSSGAMHWMLLQILRTAGALCRRSFEKELRRCAQAKNGSGDPGEEMGRLFLLPMLQRATVSAYGRDHGLAAIKSVQKFRASHPLTRYEHYAPYVERLLEGERNVLGDGRLVRLGVTSGTSGTCKLLPVTRAQNADIFTRGVALAYGALLQQLPDAARLQRTCKIMYTPRWRMQGGLQVGPNSSAPGDSRMLLNMYTTPRRAFDIADEQVALHMHVLFALLDRNLGSIEGNFAFLLYSMFVYMERHWAAIVEGGWHSILTYIPPYTDATACRDPNWLHQQCRRGRSHSC